MSKKYNRRVLYLGSNGFPFGSAMIQRQVQISKILLNIGFRVTVLNRRGTHSKVTVKKEKIFVHDYFQNIEYIYCSLSSYRSTNFLVRNILKLTGYFSEFIIIIYFILFKNAKYFIVNTTNLKDLKYYNFISSIFKIELIYDYVEYMDSIRIKDLKEPVDSINSFDFNFYKYVDKLIVISKYLKDHVNRVSPDKPIIQIPPIIDYTYFDSIDSKKLLNSYFLFCGSAGYYDIIEFVIKSFRHSIAQTTNYKLILIVYGSNEKMNKINKLIEENELTGIIDIFSKLPYSDLVSFYKSANALLIPLTDNLQDKARFPFKICEYSASGRPIITSDSGPINDYFRDNDTAFIAKTNNIESFTNKLDFVIKNPTIADRVGKSGYNLGKKVFNISSYTKEFKEFLQK